MFGAEISAFAFSPLCNSSSLSGLVLSSRTVGAVARKSSNISNGRFLNNEMVVLFEVTL
jgi:hypothetical protein